MRKKKETTTKQNKKKRKRKIHVVIMKAKMQSNCVDPPVSSKINPLGTVTGQKEYAWIKTLVW